MKKIDIEYPKPNDWWSFFFGDGEYHSGVCLQNFAHFLMANEVFDFGKAEALERKYPHCQFIFKEFFNFTFSALRKHGVDIDCEKQVLAYNNRKASLRHCFLTNKNDFRSYNVEKKPSFTFIHRDRLRDVNKLIESFASASLRTEKKNYRFFDEVQEYILSTFGGHKGVLNKKFFLDLGPDSYDKARRKFQIFEFSKDYEKSRLYGKVYCRMSMTDRTYDMDAVYINAGEKSVFLRPTNIFKDFGSKLRQRPAYWRNSRHQTMINSVMSRIVALDHFTQIVEEIGSTTTTPRQAKIKWHKIKKSNRGKYPLTARYETEKYVASSIVSGHDAFNVIESCRDDQSWTFLDFLEVFSKYYWSFQETKDYHPPRSILIKNP